MITKLDPRLMTRMAEGDSSDRKAIAGEEFLYFSTYYFRHFYTHGIAPFHWYMYNDLMQLNKGDFKYLLWVMFRDSAKTSLAKIFVAWCICFNKKHYINWDSYDKGNAESALFDIAVWLQTNKLLIRDFGQMYNESQAKLSEKKTMKRLNEFITTNDIKVEAFSTQQPVRGRLRDNFRPDLFIVDDFENALTVLSLPTMEKIKKHMENEMLGGLAVNANVIFLGNLLTEAGVMYSLIEKADKNPDFRYRRVDVEMNGEIQWPKKFVFTDKEANAINKTREPEKMVVSLESKQRTLKRAYATEMLNSPEAAGDLFFDRTLIDKKIKEAETNRPIKSVAGRMYWAKYKPDHRYAIGADTSRGVGLDDNASAMIDFSVVPNKQVLSYANNEIPPDTFAHELKAEAEDFGECLIAPEINADSGGTCINELKHIYPADKIFRRGSNKPKLGDKPTLQMGWETTSATKPEMMFGIKKAIEDGLLEIMDVRILKEARKYTQVDISEASDETTRHFDLLKACAIAWQMRNHAVVSAKKQDDYKQPDYDSISSFEKPMKADMNDNQWKQKFLNTENKSYDPFTGEMRGL